MRSIREFYEISNMNHYHGSWKWAVFVTQENYDLGFLTMFC